MSPFERSPFTVPGFWLGAHAARLALAGQATDAHAYSASVMRIEKILSGIAAGRRPTEIAAFKEWLAYEPGRKTDGR